MNKLFEYYFNSSWNVIMIHILKWLIQHIIFIKKRSREISTYTLYDF